MEFKQYASLIKHIVTHITVISACIAGGTKITLTHPASTDDGTVTVHTITVDKDAVDHITQPCTLTDGTVTGLHLYPSTSIDTVIDLGPTVIITDDPDHKDQCHNGFAYDKKQHKLTPKTFFPSGCTLKEIIELIRQGIFKMGPVDTAIYKGSRADYNLWSDCLIGQTIARLLVCLQCTKNPTTFKMVSAYPRPTTSTIAPAFGNATLAKTDAEKILAAYLATITPAAQTNAPALPTAPQPAPVELIPLQDIITRNDENYLRKNFEQYSHEISGESVLNWVVKNSTYDEHKQEVFQAIIENSSDSDLINALDLSVQKNDPLVAQLLIDNGAQITDEIVEKANRASTPIRQLIKP